ncbi:hypothetical protein HMPREF9104_02646 [Lentilactobacillus kisonensis F0435]|uniref:Uncharacterized protein n=1 Tax=Lentilactobacillus kisonensis F0435 TaxID=797516 RepID=H1LJ54_9LACO|nr:hypothetical protein HMPREF9104_02646 [Lentilactobacillus kisonensis F0435]
MFISHKESPDRTAAQSRSLHLSRLDQKSKIGISGQDNLGSSF